MESEICPLVASAQIFSTTTKISGIKISSLAIFNLVNYIGRVDYMLGFFNHFDMIHLSNEIENIAEIFLSECQKLIPPEHMNSQIATEIADVLHDFGNKFLIDISFAFQKFNNIIFDQIFSFYKRYDKTILENYCIQLLQNFTIDEFVGDHAVLNSIFSVNKNKTLCCLASESYRELFRYYFNEMSIDEKMHS